MLFVSEREEQSSLFHSKFLDALLRSIDGSVQRQVADDYTGPVPGLPGWVNAALIWPAQAAYNAQMAKLLGVAEQKPESETARMSALAGAEMAENKVIYSSAFAKVEKANSKESMQDLYDFVERLIVNVQSEVPTRPETKLKSKRDVAGMLTVGIWTFKSFKKSFKAMQQIPGVTVSMPSNPFLKRVYRLLQKMALRGGSCASIADVVRGLVTVNTTDEFVAVLKYLKTRSGGKIVDVKSRLRRTDHSEGGWSDCIVSLQFTNEDGSIGFAEVQISFNLMVNARKVLTAH